jgi:outer membrane protein TolC
MWRKAVRWIALCLTVAAAAALLACPALAQGDMDSSGEVVEIPLPPAEIEGTTVVGDGTPSAAPRAEPSLDELARPMVQVPGAGAPLGEHPVYALRPVPYSDADRVVVTLPELLEMAVANNLGIRGQELLVERDHYAVDQTYYAFDPSYQASLSYFRSNRTSSQAAQQGGSTSSEGIAASFDFTLPREYGDSFAFGYDLDRSSFSIAGDPDPSEAVFGSGATLGYNRPLLRGAGKYLNLIPRYQASNNLQLSYFQLDDRLRTLRHDVLNTYFLALAARQVIDVRQASLDRALAQLERAVERYKVGLGIQADVLQAENSVLNQRAQLLQSQEDYETLVDSLTGLVGLPVEFDLALDSASLAAAAVPELPADLWELVSANSFDLRSLNTALANLRLSRDALADATRPQLDLNASYGRTGEDTGLGGAITGLSNDSYQVGLTWRSTPGERAAKADLAQNELDLASTELEIQDVELQLKTRLRDLQRDLTVKAQQIELAQSNVVVTRETLNIVVERANVGLATTLDVIEAQEDLLLAELSVLQARIEYEQSYREILLLAGLI